MVDPRPKLKDEEASLKERIRSVLYDMLDKNIISEEEVVELGKRYGFNVEFVKKKLVVSSDKWPEHYSEASLIKKLDEIGANYELEEVLMTIYITPIASMNKEEELKNLDEFYTALNDLLKKTREIKKSRIESVKKR